MTDALSDGSPIVQVSNGPAATDPALLVAIARLETKVDVALSDHGRQIRDHEDRLRNVESKSTVSPRALWTAVTSGAGAVLAALAILEKIGAFAS